MTDQERFIAFFEKMGVVYVESKKELYDLVTSNAPSGSETYLQVGQTLFYFDKNGAYLGYESEERGFLILRAPEGEPRRRDYI